MRRLRVVVAGTMAAGSRQGGATWAVLQWVLGLRHLGHDVWFVEPVEPGTLTPSRARSMAAVAERFGMEGRWALADASSRSTAGLSHDKLRSACRTSDLLLNLSGLLSDPDLFESLPVRVYVDIDPGFNQLWHVAEGIDRRFAGHTHHVTVGVTLGQPGCPVPTLGYEWIPTLPPVALEWWPPASEVNRPALTTVANWRSYGSIDHKGHHYGQKAHSLRALIELPARTGERFELALAIHSAEAGDRALLATHGWHLVDPATVAGTPAAYQSFVRGSWAEFGVAKTGYVVSRCGWFSDRSACYLASGRPVVAQDTGFGSALPTGAGLLPFSTADDAVAAVEELRCRWPLHARAARLVAEEHLAGDRVLPRLLDRLGATR